MCLKMFCFGITISLLGFFLYHEEALIRVGILPSVGWNRLYYSPGKAQFVLKLIDIGEDGSQQDQVGG